VPGGRAGEQRFFNATHQIGGLLPRRVSELLTRSAAKLVSRRGFCARIPDSAPGWPQPPLRETGGLHPRTVCLCTPHELQASPLSIDAALCRGFEHVKEACEDREYVWQRRSADADGNPRFPQRKAAAIPVHYPESERRNHGLLTSSRTAP